MGFTASPSASLVGFAELQIAAEAAAAHGDFEAGVRILAELAHAAALAVGADRKLAGELAFRIVGAADEAAEPAELQPDPAVRAVRALARIAAVLARREQVRRQHLVERVDHLRDAQLLDVADRADEVGPEVAQQVAPGHLVVGDLVELLFEIGGEIVFDVAREEVLQERGEHAALVLGNEPLLVEPDVAAVAAAPAGSRRRSRAGRCRALPCA